MRIARLPPFGAWAEAGRFRPGGRVRFGLLAVLSAVLLTALVGSAVVWEMRTSTLQSRWFSSIAEELSWEVEPGPSPNVLFPNAAPYDDRLGYSRLPSMIESVSQRGMGVVRQARVSPTYAELVREGALYPI